VIFTAETVSQPHVPEDERVHVDNLRYSDDGIVLLEARFGFQDDPDVPATLRLAAEQGLEGDVHDPAYFLSRISILPKRGEDMVMWRKRLFAFMVRNAASPVRYFNLPEERVVSMGTTIVL
jgi:KUP system potassium uptake protein